MTRVPLVSDSAAFPAASRQIEQRRNSVSPSFHSLLWRSNVRGVEATVKLATAAPDGVNRSSGSPVRFPITVMVVSPLMPAPRSSSNRSGYRRYPRQGSGVRAQDLRPQHDLVEAQLTVELLGGVRRRGEVDDGVDALGLLSDVVRQTGATPDVDLVDRTAVVLDDGQVLVERGSDGALLDLGVEDDHDLVLTQAHTHLLWSQRSRYLRDRRVGASPHPGRRRLRRRPAGTARGNST